MTRPAHAAHIVGREIAPHLLAFVGLIALTLLFDGALHVLGLRWIGRWLGIPGVLLIVASFLYSARKRKLIGWGRPGALLRAHEAMSWAGSALILVHAGVHFNAALPWLAVVAMLANVGSGLTGKYLLADARARLEHTRAALLASGISPEALDEQLSWDTAAVDIVKQWRTVHFPITAAFVVLSLAHIFAVLLFGGQP